MLRKREFERGAFAGKWLVRLAPDRCGGVPPRASHLRAGRSNCVRADFAPVNRAVFPVDGHSERVAATHREDFRTGLGGAHGKQVGGWNFVAGLSRADAEDAAFPLDQIHVAVWGDGAGHRVAKSLGDGVPLDEGGGCGGAAENGERQAVSHEKAGATNGVVGFLSGRVRGGSIQGE